jgi:hypothetical protein
MVVHLLIMPCAKGKHPNAFRVKVSALAVLKMAMHAQSGGRIEVRAK